MKTNEEGAVVARQKMMLSMLANHSKTIRHTTNMIIVEENRSGFLSSELIVENPEKALMMLGFTFMNVSKASGLVEDSDWKRITEELARLLPTQE